MINRDKRLESVIQKRSEPGSRVQCWTSWWGLEKAAQAHFKLLLILERVQARYCHVNGLNALSASICHYS